MSWPTTFYKFQNNKNNYIYYYTLQLRAQINNEINILKLYVRRHTSITYQVFDRLNIYLCSYDEDLKQKETNYQKLKYSSSFVVFILFFLWDEAKSVFFRSCHQGRYICFFFMFHWASLMQ